MSIKELDSIAQWLYDNRVDEWSEFSDDELLQLAKLCQITKESPFGRDYDDELKENVDKYLEGEENEG